MEMDTFVSNNCIDVKDLHEYENMILENNIKNIFYGKRTAKNIEGECFLFENNTIFYTYTYHSKYGYYKNIMDYKDATLSGFENAIDYYLSKLLSIDKYNIFQKYILEEYNVNDSKIKNYEIDHSYDKSTYYLDFISIIEMIEKNKKKYNFISGEGTILHILSHLDENEEFSLEDLLRICNYGIQIIKYDVRIRVSSNLSQKYSFYIENKNDTWNKSGYWEYDGDIFINIIRNIIQKTKLELRINYDNAKSRYTEFDFD